MINATGKMGIVSDGGNFTADAGTFDGISGNGPRTAQPVSAEMLSPDETV